MTMGGPLWTAELVLQRYPDCDPDMAPEVARLFREARAMRREDTGEKQTLVQAQGLFDLGRRLAGDDRGG